MDPVREMLVSNLRSAWRCRWPGLMIAWLICGIGWVSVYMIPNRVQIGRASFCRCRHDIDFVAAWPCGRTLTPTTQLEVLQRTLLSRPNLEKLVSKTDLDLSLNNASERERLLTRLATEIKVAPQTKNLFTIVYRDRSPKGARDVVQTLLTIFIESATGGSRTEWRTHDTSLNARSNPTNSSFARRRSGGPTSAPATSKSCRPTTILTYPRWKALVVKFRRWKANFRMR